MAAPIPAPLILTARQAAFLLGPVSINVASRDAALVPSVGRGCGCRIAADGSRLAVFLSASRAAAVLRDLQGGAPFAVIFSRPRTHESRQIKAARVAVEALAPGDRELIRAYAEGFVAECVGLGYERDFMAAFFRGAEEDALAVSFAPEALFEQTPGPDAGRRLGGPA